MGFGVSKHWRGACYSFDFDMVLHYSMQMVSAMNVMMAANQHMIAISEECVCVCISVLGHRCRSDTPKRLPTTDEEHIYPEDTCGATNDVRLSLMQRYFKDVCAIYKHTFTQ